MNRTHEPGPEPLETFIDRRLANMQWQHEQGECAGIRCPWCDHARAVAAAREAARTETTDPVTEERLP